MSRPHHTPASSADGSWESAHPDPKPGKFAPKMDLKPDESYATNGSDDEIDTLSYISGQSLASTVTRYLYENGRRYHAYREGEYYQPNDDQVSSHEIIAHHLWLLTLDDKLFLAPIQQPERILDLGTGTGLWAIDIADYFPDAEIIATDLSPVQPRDAPPNIQFEIDDFTAPWTYPENHFDYVHMRYLIGCVPDQLGLYKEALKFIKPGGYIEHIEFEMKIMSPPPSDPDADRVYTKLTDAILESGVRLGKTFDTAVHMKTLMEEAGYTEVVEKRFPWPLGAWPSNERLKEIGRWNIRNWEEGIEGWVLAIFTRILGWSYQEVQDFLAEVKQKVKNRTLHYYHELRLVYGRKPLS